MVERYDVVVIGGGTGGLVTASGCARLGRRVALVEREALGGDCLWTGCVPTKALVATAKLAHQMRHAAAFGLEPVTPRISPRAIMESMREQRHAISHHDDPEKFRALGVDVIEGTATLQGGMRIDVAGRTLEAKDIVIATGGRTAIPQIDGLAECGWLDHASFLAQDDIPGSVLIFGGGYIGIEFAQIFARFGSRVTVVETREEIIGKEDKEIIARVRALLAGEGIEIITGATTQSVRREGPAKSARIVGPGGETREITVDEIFLAPGRRGNTENLGLEAAGVRVERSWIVVDRFLRTSAPRIWACGDVHGALQFTHVAAYEAVKLVRNMLFPGKSPVDYAHVPWALYTDPEVGHIGLTEEQAVERYGRDAVRIYRVEMSDVDRAVVDRSPSGLIKLVCLGNGSILGAHVFSAAESTVISEIVLARRKGMKVGELAQRISCYPSLSDGVQRAASQHYQEMSQSWLGTLGRRLAAAAQ